MGGWIARRRRREPFRRVEDLRCVGFREPRMRPPGSASTRRLCPGLWLKERRGHGCIRGPDARRDVREGATGFGLDDAALEMDAYARRVDADEGLRCRLSLVDTLSAASAQ